MLSPSWPSPLLLVQSNVQLPETEKGAKDRPLVSDRVWDTLEEEPGDLRQRKARYVPPLKLAARLLVVDLINAGFHCTVNPKRAHTPKKSHHHISSK